MSENERPLSLPVTGSSIRSPARCPACASRSMVAAAVLADAAAPSGVIEARAAGHPRDLHFVAAPGDGLPTLAAQGARPGIAIAYLRRGIEHALVDALLRLLLVLLWLRLTTSGALPL